MQWGKASCVGAVLCLVTAALGSDTSSFAQQDMLALTIGPRSQPEMNHSPTPLKPAFRKLALAGRDMTWKPARTQGMAPLITYAIISQALETKDAINCSAMKPPSYALQSSGISEASFRREVAAAFALWSDAAAIDFVETRDQQTANILIGAEASPRGHAFTNVTPSTGDASSISKALICLSPGSRWKLGFDGNLDVYDVRYTLAHEIGHAIGLDHPSRAGHLMSYRYTETREGLSDGDRAGAIAIYGPRLRRN